MSSSDVGLSRFRRMVAGAAVTLAVLSSPARAIVGGTDDPAGEASAVMILNDAGGFCTALVLDSRTLITAAHCVAGGRQLRVHWREAGQPVMRAPASVAAHPEFVRDAVQSRRRSIDLGLVRLSEPLPARFTPVSLSSGAAPSAGVPVIAAGYGPTARRDARSSGTMRRASLTTIAPYGPSNILLWASSAAAGICPGDSGGALTNGSGALVAVIAWGGTAGASGCGGPAQGILVAPQRRWIDSTLSSWGASARWN